MKYLYSTLCLLVMAVQASAATVQPTAGQVYVDRGQGYVPVSGPTTVKPGDVVMVTAGGSAQVIYKDACAQAVSVGSVVVVAAVPPCAANAPGGVDYTLIVGGVLVAGGIGAAIALSGDDDKPISP